MGERLREISSQSCAVRNRFSSLQRPGWFPGTHPFSRTLILRASFAGQSAPRAERFDKPECADIEVPSAPVSRR